MPLPKCSHWSDIQTARNLIRRYSKFRPLFGIPTFKDSLYIVSNYSVETTLATDRQIKSYHVIWPSRPSRFMPTCSDRVFLTRETCTGSLWESDCGLQHESRTREALETHDHTFLFSQHNYTQGFHVWAGCPKSVIAFLNDESSYNVHRWSTKSLLRASTVSVIRLRWMCKSDSGGDDGLFR